MCDRHLQELIHFYRLIKADVAERQMVGAQIADFLLVRVKDPFSIRDYHHHQKLRAVILLEVDYKELVRLVRWHLAGLLFEIPAEDEACASRPDERASQVFDSP